VAEPARIEGLIQPNQGAELLRLFTAGSVDDGKSTLIGRLLYDSNGVYDDQLASIRRSPVNRSSAAFDLALLTDGLRAEREQGITIDVAYRYFSTPRRKFIIADTPGHEQYTRNMATGASTANLAIILVDARKGVLQQSRRHAFIASMLGIQHLVVAVNKMDLVEYREEIFNKIRGDFSDYASRLQATDLHFIPISALNGDNVVQKSRLMPWFEGASLLHYLEDVYIASDRNLTEFRFPVQYVLRPDSTFRGYAGQVVSGVVQTGDPVMIMPGGRTTRVKSICSYDGELSRAFSPMSVALCLEDEIDVSRGDMLVPPSHPPLGTRRFDARIVWMHEQSLETGRSYLLKHTTQTVPAAVEALRYRININTLDKEPGATLALNDIGAVVIETQKPIFCDPYRRNHSTGSFILIDSVTNATVAAGMITGREPGPRQALAEPPVALSERELTAAGLHVPSETEIRYQGFTVWFTGMSGSGKSTLSRMLEARLRTLGAKVEVLDGDLVRTHLSKGLGFSKEDRDENVRRIGFVCELLSRNGVIAIAAAISPYRAVREEVRARVTNFVEVHVGCPIDVLTARDVKGLYKKALDGQLPNFTGISDPYEAPLAPEVMVDSSAETPEQSLERIWATLEDLGLTSFDRPPHSHGRI
jgi:bifunctional enzyme CysN/CysC